MQEREEFRDLEREKRCQERENKEKSMCIEKKEGKNRKERKKNKYMYERMKERRKRKKRSGNRGMRGMNQVKEKNNRVRGRMSHC
jgi:hypothetical protein